MTPAARLSAAIELLDTIETQRVPAAKALKEWGTAHRFAGSGDRAAIAGLVWDVLRRYASSAYLMDADSARARLIGMLRLERGMDVATMSAMFDGSRYAPSPLTEAESSALATRSLKGAPAAVAGDYPDWLDPYLAKVFGEDRAAEATAMASRAPLDLRVNTLKSNRDKAQRSLAHLGAKPTPWSPAGLRIELGADARNPGIQSEEDFIKGGIEVQDEGSQLAALFTAAKPGEQVIDLCAGAGGKTLALAALMQGKGRLIATDSDKRQLAPIHERLSRAGVHNADVRTPKGDADPLADIRSTADLVVIDAPCTGTGTWRRNPDAKWRMRPGALEIRLKDQAEVLERAVPLVKPGGRIAYITCSVLTDENDEQVKAFTARHPEFSVVPPEQTAGVLWDKAEAFAEAALQSEHGWLMTPRRTGTDGFFVAVLRKAG
ncbi:RsmB/NOP family class I SAM-dependent RNA methyltransferase [Bradyrhizobium manausense]|uniref:RsmB/NOP family class I SAM-dependent RNA methyltransferase n=1 Tax=Bradyrhizobium TaxID=374 RepID=UPI001BA4C85B|nr:MULTISPECIES: RsmB/NOP family class I SAM-dependent RNA methyltransferase [Bradyrhizobium]MBR0831240.1 RsmB/NOP family class I SAM-dependent RNA methyltransferase [Bradyrhizobium manausense]UVO32710.1 RsmB/NOP family class I SAM-dependent RNA methyltransferase [Bradyrhizobium arachidis]